MTVVEALVHVPNVEKGSGPELSILQLAIEDMEGAVARRRAIKDGEEVVQHHHGPYWC